MLSTVPVGLTIFYLIWDYSWQKGFSSVRVQYSAHSASYIHGELQVNVGLDGATVKLTGNVSGAGHNMVEHVEILSWRKASRTVDPPLKQALEKGCPYPVLTVVEYLTREEFPHWSKDFANAGYYTNASLWSALLFWMLHSIVECLDKSQCHYLLFATGCLLLLSAVIYTALIPWHKLWIPFDAHCLVMRYGESVYISLISGGLCMVASIWGTLSGPCFITDWEDLDRWLRRKTRRRCG